MAKETEPTTVNNFNIDAKSLVDWIAKNEQAAILSSFVQNGILNTKDGINFEALVYANWSSKDEENHTPDIKSINVVYNQEQPASAPVETASEEPNAE